MSAPGPAPSDVKHRLEALTDGIYAIALTLLVLELKLPPVPRGAGDPELRRALVELLPKGLTWLLSFWVMAIFWLAQLRLYRLSVALDWAMVWIELAQLALVSLLPFSTALLGEHGGHATSAAVYGAHLLAIAVLSALRTSHFLRHPELQVPGVTPVVKRTLRVRAGVLLACTAATLLLAFVVPGWNMVAMLPTALLPVVARL